MKEQVPSDSGFTLLEVIVALAIVSLGMTAFALAQRDAFRAESRLRNYDAMIGVARSQLDRVVASGDLQGGEYTGNYDAQTSWRLKVTPLPDPRSNTDESRGDAFWIQLFVTDRSGKSVFTLQTAKTGQ